MDWAVNILTNHLVIAFFSAYFLVVIDISGIAVTAMVASSRGIKQTIAMPEYLKLKFWWFAMTVVCCLNATIIHLYMTKGVVFTPTLIVQVCLASTYSLKTISDRTSILDEVDV